MFYRNLSGLMLSDLPGAHELSANSAQPLIPAGLLSRFFLTGSVLAAPFIALFVVLLVQGLNTP
jgi:hypothetical protein